MSVVSTGPSTTSAEAKVRRERRRDLLRSLGGSLLNALITVIVVLVLWQCVLSFTSISPYVAKGPVDVWKYLFVTDPSVTNPNFTAAAHRATMGPLLSQTMRDAGIGFVTGMVIATVLALLFTLSKSIEAGVMPLALLLRSVPLVAIAPLIILITGVGSQTSVAVIGSIVVLFPALASILFGLSRANPQSLDVIHVYGGGSLMALLKVAIPGALPSIFAAARVSVPGAVTGAMLAEWLSTGKGVGGHIIKFNAQARFADLWTSVALITLLTLVLYNVVQVVENIVLARMGMQQKSD